MFSSKEMRKFALEKKDFIDENNNIEPPMKRRKTALKLEIGDAIPREKVDEKKKLKHKKVQSKWAYLPPEILAKIFGYVVETEQSALPYLLQFSKVCRHWKSVTSIPFIWTHLWFRPSLLMKEDVLKNNKKCFESLAMRCFSDVHSLMCTGLTLTASYIMQTVACNAKKLKSINLLRCSTRFSYKNCLKVLMEKHKQHIEELVIRDVNISSFDLRKIIGELGETLQKLEIHSPTLYREVNTSFQHLKNLRVLKIESGEMFKMRLLKELQHLTIVHLTNMRLDTKGCMEIDWADLEDLDLSCRDMSYGSCESDNRMLIRMLRGSPKIKHLSLRNRVCSVVDLIDGLDHCRFIKYLDISGSYGTNLSSLLLILAPSLEELHLDKYGDINYAVYGTASTLYWQSIKTLSLRGTEIFKDVLGALLGLSLKDIKVLDLSGCRYLPRGCRRKWTQEENWQILCDKLWEE